MPIETIALVFFFAVSMVGSPGPANMALMASGARFGYRKSVPFLFGTLSGFVLVGIGVAVGVGTLFANFPALKTTFLVLSAGYILYLAYKIAFQKPKSGEALEQPGYFSGCLIHPLNPKAWVMMIAALSQFVDPGKAQIIQLVTIQIVFSLTGVVLNSVWVFAGALVHKHVKSEKLMSRINQFLAVLMIIVVALAIFRSGILN
ncbi:LysE family translocator [Sneathiella sp.]|jgi:threonine/homoserine/homoserine lactone efflux protein|uniref:LysE family translocator n=1 Tax=Sneathiella sp. TaxID=1964365 RepID=UPI0039E30EC0